MPTKRLQLNITAEVAEAVDKIKKENESYDMWLRRTLGLKPGKKRGQRK